MRSERWRTMCSPRWLRRGEHHVVEHGHPRRAPWSAGTCAPCRRARRGTPAPRPASRRRRTSTDRRPGWSNPVRRLNSVVLPAPFGPISAVIAPRCDLEVVDVDRGEAAERAADPVDRRGSGRASATPGSRRRRRRSVGTSPGIEQHLLALAEDALRSEDHQQHQQQADEHEPHRADVGVNVDPKPIQPASIASRRNPSVN